MAQKKKAARTKVKARQGTAKKRPGRSATAKAPRKTGGKSAVAKTGKKAAGKRKSEGPVKAGARKAAKKKPTKKSAKKKAAKKKPAVPRRRATPEALTVQPSADLRVPQTPRPVSIPGAWPFPMGNRS
jgi:hypothetical protein